MSRAKPKRNLNTGRIRRRGRKPKRGDRLQDSSPPESKDVAPSSIVVDFVAPERLLLFPKFPQEIRLKIWAMAADEQRVVIIDLDRQETETGERRSSSPPPVILHACVEAREVALNCYTLTFGRSGLPGRIYFNFDQDILFLHRTGKIQDHRGHIAPVQSPDSFSLLNFHGKERIRYLGFDLNARNDTSISHRWYDLEKWPALNGFYVGLQDLELDLNAQISCIPLPKKDYKTFSTAFFKIRRFFNHETPIPWRPVLARIEWIRTQCIQNVTVKEQSRYDEIKKASRLVKIVNTSSL
ncbi:hypothetical protein VE03_06050 [Pseudogymnoascus sp. 23342-1-I1]|nr:hypothetical protein VE03_06050 [Pseudogymnoascus sp. 23342-1-I1]